jgi:agmatinase
MNLSQKIASFDPNNLATQGSGIFGLPFDVNSARVVVVPVPWEVTVSYGGGTLHGPEAIYEASKQVDLYDPELPDAWKLGVAMDKVPAKLKTLSRALRKHAERQIDQLGKGKTAMKSLGEVNEGCRTMVDHVRKTISRHLKQDKMVALVGGDHSTPLGFLQALAETRTSFGILQIDAHADLRDAYEGFEYSHASIMFNALKIKQVTRLVQVGIRDYCQAEVDVVRRSRGRVITHFDRDLKHNQYAGIPLINIHRAIVKDLPAEVYISFDIDGLDPKLCPHTGTPVPGGFEFEEALHLIKAVVVSGRKIIGFDINEVSPGKDSWDANVGARLLFRMINLMAKSQKVLASSATLKRSRRTS